MTTCRSHDHSGRSATWPEASHDRLRRRWPGAAPHDIQTLLIDELDQPPSPTVLVLEDVHWADDATLDSIVVLGRRIACVARTDRADVPPRRSDARASAARQSRRDPSRRYGSHRARTTLGMGGHLDGRRERPEGLCGDPRQPVLRQRVAGVAHHLRSPSNGRQRGDRSGVPARRGGPPARRARVGRARAG